MLNEKFMEVVTSPPDSAFAIVSQGPSGPHVVNSWNSYIIVTEKEKLLIPAGRMIETEKNIKMNNNVLLTITNREVIGKSYKGTGFLLKGKASFVKEGPEFDLIYSNYP